MKNGFTKIMRTLAPTLSATVIFLVVSLICFAPQLEGRMLPQHDIQQFDGMSRDIRQCRADYGEDPQWSGAMFGGMPAYLINIRYPAQIIKRSADWALGIVDTPAGFIFFAMMAAWLMILMMGISPWIGIVCGLAYGLSTYFFLIIGAGHVTKMWALVFAPAMVGSIYMTLRGRLLVGGALTALFASLEIGANHPQVTYYFLLAAAALWINDLVFALRERHLADFTKRTAILLAAALMAVGSNFAPLWYTAQHTKNTTRGGSEIAATTNPEAAHGLDLQYATAWSYGLAESWNMIIPDFAGGDSASTFSGNGAVADSLKDLGLSSLATQLPTYWGGEPYTAGPTYLGVVAVLLALLGAIVADNRNRWWILAATLLAIMLAWGHNFMWFTEFCFKYLPLYNKFRTVSMALVVAEWSIPLLAGIGLWQLWRNGIDSRRIRRAIGWSVALLGGITLLFALAGASLFDFAREQSGEMMSEEFRYMLEASGGEEYVRKGVHDELGWAVADAMATERAEIMARDAWRSFAFVILTAAALLAFSFGRLRREWLLAIVGTLLLVDMVPVNLRYAPFERFVAERKTKIQPSAADRRIMADKSLGYRVLNLSVSPFNDATTSMFHRSVGGYHGAKLGRYQDVIDRYLVRGDEAVLDILNTKYIISRDGDVVERTTANSPAWFVEELEEALSATEELNMLGSTDLRRTAIVAYGGDTAPERLLPAESIHFGKGEISLTEYRPNYLRYEYTAESEAAAVFSEIYFADGWTMLLDGKPAPFFRADYILRGALLPAGTHVVEWRFRAPHWAVCEGITLVCSIAIILILIALILFTIYGKKRCGSATQS